MFVLEVGREAIDGDAEDFLAFREVGELRFYHLDAAALHDCFADGEELCLLQRDAFELCATVGGGRGWYGNC